MSSLYRDDRSPNWTACFTAHIGQHKRQLKKSTGTADKELAKLIALKLEEAGRGCLSAEKVTPILLNIEDLRARQAVRRAFDEVLRLVVGVGLENRTTRSYVTAWLERTKGEVAPTTLQRYDAVASQFLKSLGGKADQDSASLAEADILRFRDEEAKRVSVSTVNLSMKILRVMFADARAVIEIIKEVKTLKKRGKATLRRLSPYGN